MQKAPQNIKKDTREKTRVLNIYIYMKGRLKNNKKRRLIRKIALFAISIATSSYTKKKYKK